ncbi:MAG: adenylate kinase [Candidatus Eisenbacteria bacterium]|nr:adenylate kinase [Candidatus Eisenbacteria bacterium]
MIIVLAGAPGAGKGTHAKRVAGTFGVPHVSTGDLLRGAVEAGTELGKKAHGYMEAGELVPDEIMLSVVGELLDSPEWADGVVLDGFPRTLPQAEGFDRLLDGRGRSVDLVVFFDLSEEAAVERLSARLSCPRDGTVYNLKTKPPKNDELCDVCGGPLERRADDEPETIRARHEEYRRLTGPMIEHYKDQGLVARIDAERGIDAVWQQVSEALEDLTADSGSGDAR